VLGVIDVPETVKAREKQEAMVRRLQAEEKRAQAAVALAEADLKAAEASRDQAQADISMTQARLSADEAEFNRVQDLVSNKAVADRLLDEARLKRDSSSASQMATEAAFQSAKANVAVSEQKLAVAKADWQTAQAKTEVAQKELEEADALLAYATLTAPFDGVVVQVDLGDDGAG